MKLPLRLEKDHIGHARRIFDADGNHITTVSGKNYSAAQDASHALELVLAYNLHREMVRLKIPESDPEKGLLDAIAGAEQALKS
jgi:hypothetical protein